jgi:uncharacterized protein
VPSIGRSSTVCLLRVSAEPRPFSPRFYPKAVLDYANTRGADRLIYGGYFPMGLSLERFVTEMSGVPLHDDVWPGFLRDNAARVLGIAPR